MCEKSSIFAAPNLFINLNFYIMVAVIMLHDNIDVYSLVNYEVKLSDEHKTQLDKLVINLELDETLYAFNQVGKSYLVNQEEYDQVEFEPMRYVKIERMNGGYLITMKK